MPKHIHAELMMLYSQDAMETDKPWERWETLINQGMANEYWEQCTYNTWFWNPLIKYRRKPKTININGFEIPEPLRASPEIGTTYYLVDLYDDDTNHYDWDGDESDFKWLSLGLIHLTEKAAQLHQKAILSFTKVKD